MTIKNQGGQGSPLVRRARGMLLPVAALTVAALAAIGSMPKAEAKANDLQGVKVYGVTSANRLISFNAKKPTKLLSRVEITGLRNGETIQGIDFRPAQPGTLYALGTASGGADQLYTVDLETGAATPVGVGTTPALTGTQFGFDFNPAVDRIRVVTAAEENLRLHPDTGALVATDTALSYAPGDVNAGRVPDVAGAAYSNPDLNLLTGTTLYGIDTVRDTLVIQGSRERTSPAVSPNAGLLTTVGRLGVNATGPVGFDIIGDDYGFDDTAYVALATIKDGRRSRLLTINLYTGKAKAVGTVNINEVVTGIAIQLPSPL